MSAEKNWTSACLLTCNNWSPVVWYFWVKSILTVDSFVSGDSLVVRPRHNRELCLTVSGQLVNALSSGVVSSISAQVTSNSWYQYYLIRDPWRILFMLTFGSFMSTIVIMTQGQDLNSVLHRSIYFILFQLEYLLFNFWRSSAGYGIQGLNSFRIFYQRWHFRIVAVCTLKYFQSLIFLKKAFQTLLGNLYLTLRITNLSIHTINGRTE